METIHCPYPIFPIPSSLINHPTQRGRTQLPFLTKQRNPLPLRSPLRTQALNNALSIAADPPATAAGDISVLIPISAVLFSVYWIANFVVPEMISKDFQKKASEGEETPEWQANASRANNASAPSKPRQRIKKEDLKKMIRPR